MNSGEEGDWICVNCAKQLDKEDEKFRFLNFIMCSIQCCKNFANQKKREKTKR